jgi:hypothetical protein
VLGIEDEYHGGDSVSTEAGERRNEMVEYDALMASMLLNCFFGLGSGSN